MHLDALMSRDEPVSGRLGLSGVRSVALCAAVAAVLVACAPVREAATVEDSWQSIFDGESLEGWTPKVRGAPVGENFGDMFRAGDGVLTVSFDQLETFDNRFGHLFYETEYTHYRLRLDYRFVGEQTAEGPDWAIQNSGVMLHAQPPETMRLDQPFPVSIEAQFLGAIDADAPGRTTGNVCTPGTHIELQGELVTGHCINSEAQARPLTEWVSFEAEVCGSDSIRLYVNGEPSFELFAPQYDPGDGDTVGLFETDLSLGRGYFALQAESHPLELRGIEIKPLTAVTCGDAVQP